MWGVLVLHPVTGQERDLASLDAAHGDRCGGIPVRRVDVDLADALQERVEPGPTKYADPDGLVPPPAQADFSFVLEVEGLSALSAFADVPDVVAEDEPSPEESEVSPPLAPFDPTPAFDRESVE
jgi:hypothetical protein